MPQKLIYLSLADLQTAFNHLPEAGQANGQRAQVKLASFKPISISEALTMSSEPTYEPVIILFVWDALERSWRLDTTNVVIFRELQ